MRPSIRAVRCRKQANPEFWPRSAYGDCQRHTHFAVIGAALLQGDARGWTADAPIARDPTPRNGRVWVHFGPCPFVGWVVVKSCSPPPEVLPLVRHL